MIDQSAFVPTGATSASRAEIKQLRADLSREQSMRAKESSSLRARIEELARENRSLRTSLQNRTRRNAALEELLASAGISPPAPRPKKKPSAPIRAIDTALGSGSRRKRGMLYRDPALAQRWDRLDLSAI